MRAIVTLAGIDEAIKNLGYTNDKHIKTRFIKALRQYYSDENSIRTVTEINSDDLIRFIWDTDGSHEAIRNKRKNFSSIKSSINSDLSKLDNEGKNTEGVIVGRKNTFDMSDKAKNELLENFTSTATGDGLIPLGKINDVLGIVNDILKKNRSDTGTDDPEDDKNSLDQLKELIQSISQRIGIPGNLEQDAGSGRSSVEEADSITVFHPQNDSRGTIDEGGSKGTEKPGGVQNIEAIESETEAAPADDVEEIDDLEMKEIEDDEEIVEDDEDIEEIDTEEIPEHEVEEIEELDASQELDEVEDDVDIVEADDDIEEVDVEEIPEDEVEDEVEKIDDLEEVDAEEVPEDEVEEVEELNEPQELDDIDDEVGYLNDVEVEDGDDGEPAAPSEEENGVQNARLFADEFNNILSALDKFYNQYILIPGGKYQIGSKAEKRNGSPSGEVDVKAFYFGMFPVTNALFEIFIEKTGYITTAERIGRGTVYYGRYQNVVDNNTGLKTLNWSSTLETKVVEGACWYQPAGPGSTLYNKRHHPVVQVSLEDAMAFAAWTGKRLPSEAQWEAATRTLDTNKYPWGNEFKEGRCNLEDSYIGDTTPVDKYTGSENSFGVMDALGNVMEWTVDKSKSSAQDRHDNSYIVKGGSWISGNDLCLDDRILSGPDSTSNILGFRCVAY